MHKSHPAVDFSHISMHFPGVLANDDISLSIMPGEVFALVGENGAGKTTLMNILYGLYTPTVGSIRVKGQPIHTYSPAHAIAMGIGMVHQHFMLVPSFTVAQNIALSREPKRAGLFYDFVKAKAQVRELIGTYGLPVDPDARVDQLSLGLQQRVEILKTLSRGADILILDEPTAVLTPKEAEELFAVVRRIVKEKGMTVILITHKLYEVMAVSDRVGVMRGGRLLGVRDTKDVDERILSSLMVGSEVLLGPMPRPAAKGDRVLEITDLHARSDRDLPALRGLSLALHQGEILGVAGIGGNGQSELAEAIAGLRTLNSGEIRLFGKDTKGLSPGKIRALGLAHIPEDRLLTGIASQGDVTDNLLAGKQRQKRFSRLGIHLRRREARRYASSLYQDYDIRGGGVDTPAGHLSGGNVQKLVVAREFSGDAPVMIVSQPTRGLDIGAMEFIHQSILKKRNEGCAILLISADLDEIFRLSDRIVTLYEGRITGEFTPDTITKADIGYYMTGGRKAPQKEDAP